MGGGSRNTQLLVASAVGVAAVTVAYFLSSGKLSGGSADDANLAPALTEDEAVKIMTAVMDKFKLNYISIMQYAAQIKQQYAGQGMQVDDAELMGHLLPQAEKAFQESEAAVYSDFDVDSSEVEDAVNSYLEAGNCPELADIVSKIRRMYKELGGQLEDSSAVASTKKKSKSSTSSSSKKAAKSSSSGKETDTDDDDEAEDAATGGISSLLSGAGSGGVNATAGACTITTVDHFVGFVDAMAEKMAEFFDGYFDAFVAEYGPLSPNSPTEVQQRFQMGMVKLAEEVQQAFFVSTNMTEKHFEALLMAHQNDERVQMAFMKLQYATQSRMQARMAQQQRQAAGAGAGADDEEEEVARVEEL